jgi:enoyl-CoA hydratase
MMLRGENSAEEAMMLDVELRDGVSVVTLDPSRVNALDLELLQALTATVTAIDTPAVLTGAGTSFSAGVDLRRIVEEQPDYTVRFLAALSNAFLAVFNHPAPVVAAVNGHAIAGGCVIVQACDVRIMSAGTIGITELAVGVPFPVAALEICRHALGTGATRAALGAATLEPADAKAVGLIDEIVQPDALLPRALTVAGELARHAPSAFAFTKRQLHEPALAAISARSGADDIVRESWTSEETRDRIAGFLRSLASRNR